jgi:hypothetical protein
MEYLKRRKRKKHIHSVFSLSKIIYIFFCSFQLLSLYFQV